MRGFVRSIFLFCVLLILGLAAYAILAFEPPLGPIPPPQASSFDQAVVKRGADIGVALDGDADVTIAGDATRDAATATALREQIVRLGLADRITMLGTLSTEALDRVYGESDAFVLASHYEGYGMAYAEALAHGLPVIGTTGGAIADTVPQQAGILVEPGHVDALAKALATLIGDANRRVQLAAGARTAASNLPTWAQSCALFSGALEQACTD